MKGNRGLTLVELLVTFILLTLITVMIYRGYVSVVRETSRIYFVAKDEKELRTFIYQMIKDIKSAGFGVGKNEIDSTPPGIISDCDFPSTDVPTISKCEDNNGNDQLYLLSMASRNITESGCWGFVDTEGCIRISYNTIYGEVRLSKDILGRGCDSLIDPTGRFMFLDINRNIIDNNVVSGPCSSDSGCSADPNVHIRCPGYENTIFIYLGNDNAFEYPQDFQVRYYLSPVSSVSPCAPNTYNLMRQINGGVAQPILSCVAGMKIYYGKVDPSTGDIIYSDTISDPSDPSIWEKDMKRLKSVVVCMAVQIGRHKVLKSEEVITFGSKCGNLQFTFNDERRSYRWKVVEEEIPLRNIGAIVIQQE